MTRQRKALGHAGDTAIAAGLTRGHTAKETAAELQARGIKVSPRTVSRRMAEQRSGVYAGRAAKMRAATPPAPRTAKRILASLSASDREIVIAYMTETAELAVEARNEEIAEVLERLGREQAACPICPTCGLQGSSSRLVRP